MAVVLNPKYKDLFKTDKRYILVTGGRGSQKSFTVSTFLNLLTYEQGQNILFTRYTMASAEISIIPEFCDKINKLEVPNDFNVNKTDITNLRTDSVILFKGIKTSSGNQTANLKSLAGISCFVVDEAEEFTSEEDFDTIDLSIRSQVAQNRVIIIMNPTNKSHWVYKRWIGKTHRIEIIDGYPVEISTHPNVLHIHTTYLDNLKHLSQSFLDIVNGMKINTPELYAHKAIGQWSDGAYSNLWAFAFDRLKHVGKCEINTSYDVKLAFDFNKNPITCNVIQDYDYHIKVIEAISLNNSDIYALCDYIKEHYPNMLYVITGDASGRNSSALVKDNLNFYLVIKQQLLLTDAQIKVPTVNPRLEDNQVLVNALFSNYKITIDEEAAKYLIFDLENVRTTADGGIQKQNRSDAAQRADSLDGFRYYCNVFQRDLLKLL